MMGDLQKAGYLPSGIDSLPSRYTAMQDDILPLRPTWKIEPPPKARRKIPETVGLHLYIIQSDVTGAIKVGRSSNPARRLDSLQTGSPHRLRLLAWYEGKGDEERKIHRLLMRHRLKVDGEWFDHECLASLPGWIYERLPLEDADWWRG